MVYIRIEKNLELSELYSKGGIQAALCTSESKSPTHPNIISSTSSHIKRILENANVANTEFPLVGPRLMLCELEHSN